MPTPTPTMRQVHAIPAMQENMLIERVNQVLRQKLVDDNGELIDIKYAMIAHDPYPGAHEICTSALIIYVPGSKELETIIKSKP